MKLESTIKQSVGESRETDRDFSLAQRTLKERNGVYHHDGNSEQVHRDIGQNKNWRPPENQQNLKEAKTK